MKKFILFALLTFIACSSHRRTSNEPTDSTEGSDNQEVDSGVQESGVPVATDQSPDSGSDDNSSSDPPGPPVAEAVPGTRK